MSAMSKGDSRFCATTIGERRRFVHQCGCMAALAKRADLSDKSLIYRIFAQVPMPLRVLVSEGSSTSAREAITILGLSGHRVEICDPSPWCLGRFSRFVKRFHRCPPLRDDPSGYLAFIEALLASGDFDVLLPIHEQGFLFARVQQRLAGKIALASPSFEGYRTAHGKAGFSRLLSELGLPQPATAIVTSESELRAAARFPAVIKTSIGTASRGVWFVRDAHGLDEAVRELVAADAFADEVLVQDLITGTTEKAQSVFCRGELVGFHAYRGIALGVGGGEAIKESVSRPEVRAMLEKIGARLAWHGALSVDYLVPDQNPTPLLIDCNPRLVEPMSAYLAGTDLVGLLLEVSRGATPAALPASREGVRTHLAMQALLGIAARNDSRRDLLRECRRLARSQGPYAGSREEMTPLALDWMSTVPLAMTAALLLARPKAANALARGGFGAHLLSRESIRTIEDENFS
jgi:predicted ATP-grasp superfamily ATP-dependent carboligase